MAGKPDARSACQNWYQNIANWTQERTSFHIRPAQKTDMMAVNQLRAAAFSEATEFRLKRMEPVLWDIQDDNALILNVINGAGEIVATMRGVIASTQAEVEAQLEARLPPSLDLKGSVMILERGATRRDVRGMGLNSVLRLYFLRWAHERGIAHMLGSIYAGAPRTGVMKAIGYKFHEIIEDMDQWPVENLSPRMIAALDLDADGDKAIRLLAEKHRHLIQK